MTKPQLHKANDISLSTFTRLNKNEYVSMEIFIWICVVLGCEIGDIIEVL